MIAAIITGGVLATIVLLGLFISDRDDSHFTQLLNTYHQRKLKKMENDLEIERLKVRALETPMPR